MSIETTTRSTKSQTQTLVPLNPLHSPEMDCLLNKAVILFSNNAKKLAEKLLWTLPREVAQPLLMQICTPSPQSTPSQTILSFLFEAKKKEFAALTKKWDPYHASKYKDVSQTCRKGPLKDLMRSCGYDATLVKLKDNCLNAHLVLGGKYILTEHPRRASFGSFWQMIDEYDVPVIFMLNRNGERDTDPYFPLKWGDTELFGPYSVTLKEVSKTTLYYEDEQRDYTIASIKELHYSREKGEPKKTVLVHFRYWSDGETPFEQEMRFFIGLKKQYMGPGKGPAVFHCRKGLGRTGVFCVIDYLFSLAQKFEPFSVLSVVEQLRHPETGRHPLMVSNEEQYLYCHTFLWEQCRTPRAKDEEKSDKK